MQDAHTESFIGQSVLKGWGWVFFPHQIPYHSRLSKVVECSEVPTNFLGFIWDLGRYFY